MRTIIASSLALVFALARPSRAAGEAVPFDHIGSSVFTNFTGTVTKEMLADGDALLVYDTEAESFSFSIDGQAKAWVLAVGGGGSGGAGATAANLRSQGAGGGGGGGGFVEDDDLILGFGTYAVTVGKGGARKNSGSGNPGNPSKLSFPNGDVIEALGGGAGASKADGGSVQADGRSAGSGGGGSAASASAKHGGGTGMTGQGRAGGAGNFVGGAGGGGGAGGDGVTPTAANKGGNGGAGRASMITGEELYYAAGGGGGAAANASIGKGGSDGVGGNGAGASTTAYNPGAGKNGFGGGGGGGAVTSTRYSGKGGDGTVIIRITKMYDLVTKPATTASYPYGGTNIFAIAENEAYTMTGTYFAKDAGTGYICTVYLLPGLQWEDHTSDPVTITWSITKATNFIRDLALESWRVGETPPEPTCTKGVGEVVYTYYDKNGTILGEKPTTPGLYQVSAAITETVNFEGATAEPVPFRILDVHESPLDALAVFAKVDLSGYADETVKKARVRVNFPAGYDFYTALNDGSDVRFCDAYGTVFASELIDWDDEEGASFNVVLPKLSASATLYACWGPVVNKTLPSKPTMGTFTATTTTFEVGTCDKDPTRKLENFFESVSIGSWRVGETAKDPVSVYKVATNGVNYTYYDDNGHPLDARPETPGIYTMRAEIVATGDYEGATAGPAEFRILDRLESPLDSLGVFAKVTLAGASATPFETKITVKIPKDYNFITSFNDGSDIRFCDEIGNILPHTIVSWADGADKSFTVILPKLEAATAFYMCWGPVVGATVPPVPTGKAYITRTTSVTIAPAALDEEKRLINFIRDLTLTSWRESESANEPECTCKITTNGVVYTYLTAEGEVLGEKPTAPGSYQVTAEIIGTPAYQGAKAGPVAFKILGDHDSPLDSLAYFQKVTFPTYTGVTLSNALVTIKFQTANRKQAFNDYSDVRFCDADGNVYAFTRSGTTFSVEVPHFSADSVIYMCWGPVVGRYLPGRSDPGETVSVGTAAKYGTADRDLTRVPLVNHWVTEPSIPGTWDEGKSPTISRGEAAYQDADEPVYVFMSHDTGVETTNAVPAEVGFYRVTFTVTNGAYWAGITSVREVCVVGHDPYSDLTDGADDLSASGRILLMNADTNEAAPVFNQGYADDNTSKSTCWILSNWTPSASPLFNLKKGTDSSLWTRGPRRKLWQLVDCRHGNNYPTNDTASLTARLNYLPYSATSCGISAPSPSAPAARHDAGQIVMRNTLGAAVYSSCLTNGIGTIYFDAVNGAKIHQDKDGNEMYDLVVRVARGAADGDSWSPTDPVDWGEPVPLKAFRIENNKIVETIETNRLSLAITRGGSNKYFYRVAVPVDCYTNVRFKIERVSIDPAYTRYPDQVDALILLDNIIASYPAVRAEMTTLGAYDPAKAGKQTVGQVGAFSVPLPSAGVTNLLGHGRVIYRDSPALGAKTAAASLVGVKLNYRWRYLNQEFQPADGSFLSVALDKANDFLSVAPLALPDRPGDVEYFYETVMDAPYYKYVDYTGANIGTGFYTEEVTFQTNRAALVAAPSLGTDWFIRLRDGASDYEAMDLVIINAKSTNRVAMALWSDHIWRGYLPTVSNATGAVSYRFEGRNRQTPLAGYAVNTNFFRATEDATSLPLTGTIAPCGAGEAASLVTDASTGYLLFQIDDDVRSLTVVHADYQDFNTWHDAVGPKFVGDSVEDGKKRGTSHAKTEYTETFNGWKDMPATKDLWMTPSFDDIRHLRGRDPYVPFKDATDNYWTIGPGMWISRFYADESENVTGKGVSLQMEGSGNGYIEFTDVANAPRGLESISFRARLAQFINFNDFDYYNGGDMTVMTNYTFTARAAFDANGNRDFSGNAALSLVAYLQPAKGCYEARWEQRLAQWDGAGNMRGPSPSGQRLSLYRWNADASGKMTAERLTYFDNNEFNAAQTLGLSSGSSYQPLFISVTNLNNETVVTVGVRREPMSPRDTRFTSGDGWMCLVYHDGTAKRHTAGTYGLLSTDCNGIFIYPQIADRPAVATHGKNVAATFPSVFRNCYADLDEDRWVIHRGRMRYNEAGDYRLKGLVADPTPQKLAVYTAAAGRGTNSWDCIATKEIEGFGSLGGANEFTIPLYTTKNCAVRIAAGGAWDDIRTDIAIDSVVLRQWRGDDWANLSDYIPGWRSEDYTRYGATNFIFTSAWIDKEAVLLSAKRATATVASSIRSPLLDGYSDRGIGLGMLAFSYRNAQPNAKLLVQVATNNVSSVDVANHNTEITSGYWTTVTNIDFSVMSAEEREGGLFSCYLGLHGVAGLMRLVVDPAAVAAVADETDPAKFGEVTITKIVCRDEPALDSGCWWGWNLRMVGGDADTEKRMYLSDAARDPAEIGLSLALNSSAVEDIADPNGKATYREHIPFVQTPTFSSNVVGEVSFKARKYGYPPNTAKNDQPASVTLYGSLTGDDDKDWKALKTFIISNSTYTSYSYKTSPGQSYRAFRLGVSGAAECIAAGEVVPDEYDSAVRVLIDEVLVSEAIRARMAFRNVGVFRNDMSGTKRVPNVPSASEQPILNEAWGVQAEVYAAQLANEIDLTRKPQVHFWWFWGKDGTSSKDGNGTDPWGFENWRELALKAGTHAWLAEAEDAPLTFRSSNLSAPKAVVRMSTQPGTVIQYALEVVWYQAGSDTPATNVMTAGEWPTPDWYRPIDYNREYGAGKSFAAYNILDAVAPNWAWINEVNLYGTYDKDYMNSDADAQFIEIAVPAGADISGWSVRMLEAVTSRKLIITNTIAMFSTRPSDPAPTKNTIYSQSNMSFRVIGNLNSRKKGYLSVDNGTLDGTWHFDRASDVFYSSGEVSWLDPIGIQLVRSSGIVEQEIVVIGTNWYGEAMSEYSPEETVKRLNEAVPGAAFFVDVGADDAEKAVALTGSSYERQGRSIYGTGLSLGVMSGHGETIGDWSNAKACTPGSVNVGQIIDSTGLPTPNGEMIVVNCSVDTAFGHIVQTVGDGIETNAAQSVMIQRGSKTGTNIVYRVDDWYELGDVVQSSQSAVGAPAIADLGDGRYRVTVGVGASNMVSVVASARVNEDLRENYGLDEENAYTPAVMSWLEGGRTLRGEFADPGTIRLAERINIDDTVITNLTLTEMYWLDMDPTVGGLALKGYMASPPVLRPFNGLKNLRMDVFMMITNRDADAHWPLAWTPYVLRGLRPGELSWDFAEEEATWGWTSVTFKVTGFLQTGLTNIKKEEYWIPLRYFVITEDSFRQEGEAAPYTSSVEIIDPFSKNSPAYNEGWYDWVQRYGQTQEYYKWHLDTRIKPINIEVLRKVNYYEE